jgi:hypothetical protein
MVRNRIKNNSLRNLQHFDKQKEFTWFKHEIDHEHNEDKKIIAQNTSLINIIKPLYIKKYCVFALLN